MAFGAVLSHTTQYILLEDADNNPDLENTIQRTTLYRYPVLYSSCCINEKTRHGLFSEARAGSLSRNFQVSSGVQTTINGTNILLVGNSFPDVVDRRVILGDRKITFSIPLGKRAEDFPTRKLTLTSIQTQDTSAQFGKHLANTT